MIVSFALNLHQAIEVGDFFRNLAAALAYSSFLMKDLYQNHLHRSLRNARRMLFRVRQMQKIYKNIVIVEYKVIQIQRL